MAKKRRGRILEVNDGDPDGNLVVHYSEGQYRGITETLERIAGPTYGLFYWQKMQMTGRKKAKKNG